VHHSCGNVALAHAEADPLTGRRSGCCHAREKVSLEVQRVTVTENR
jgi:hypothetical protein